MLIDIIEVRPLEKYRIYLRFEDGIEGMVDISNLIQFTGVFAPLQNLSYFAQVSVNPSIGTICWPNDADIDPDVLYSLVSGEPIPNYEPDLADMRNDIS